MSATIDQRVVEMRFDNRQFESNVSTTMSTLEKLKQRLNLTGATKGLEEVGAAAKGINLSGLGGAIETVSAKFSAFQVAGITAIANVTNSAVNAGKRIVSALTIDPIKTGLSEYETQINAVQTILANTESKGTTLGQVNAALDQLNTYADKTIYNFTEMTRNIGTFTAAGVDLDTSVNAIQGIANLAAVSGSNSQQASTAMYQLSQALASGTVKLMDWNSVVNAGMGGQVFQDALKETARVHGVKIDDMIKKQGSFRETLQEGWLTADILTETLSHFTMAAEEGSKQWETYKKALVDDGYTEEQATAILKLSNTATDAATKVKTATQLWDTLKETAQSGWTQTWEIILGDFGEAKELFSGIYETLSPILEATSEARNALLTGGLASGWKQLLGQGIADEEGYRDSIKAVAKDHGVAVDDMIAAEKKLDSSLDDNAAFEKALKKGLKDGSVTSDMLSESVTHLADKMRNMTDAEREAAGYTEEHIAQIEALEAGLKDGSISMDEFTAKMLKPSGRENLITSLKNAFDGLMNIIKPVKEAFRDIFPPMTSEQIYGFTENFKNLTAKFKEFGTKYADQIKRTFKGIFSIVDIGKKIFTAFGNSLMDLAGSSGVTSVAEFILNTAASIGDFFTSLNENFDVTGVTDIFSSLASGVSSALGKSVDVFKGFGSALSTIGDFIVDVASKIWEGVKTAFSFVTENFSIGDIFAGLAGGGIFVAAKKFMGLIDKFKESFDGGLMGVLFGKKDDEDSGSIKDKFSELLDGVGETLQSFTSSVKVGSFVAIAAAIAILASAFGKISELNAEDIAKSLITMGIALGIMMKALNSMPTNKAFATSLFGMTENTNLIKSGISLMLMAKAIDILSDAILKLSELSWEEIAKGLFSVGGGIGLLCGGLKILNGTKVSLGTSVAMLALAEACKILGDAMAKFVGFSWDEIVRGLAGMGGALGELVIALSVLSKAGGFGALLGSGGILIAVQSLADLADGLKQFADMTWDEIGRGLAGMGGAIGELAIVLGALSKISTVSISGNVFAGIFGKLGGAKGSGGFSASISGLSHIFSAGAIWVVIQGLKDLAAALKDFSSMSWPEIGAGLGAMGGALAEVAAAAGLLGKLAGFSSVFGAGAIWITVQSLSDLATAFKEFASMSWDGIDRAVVAMFDALAEVAGAAGILGKLAGFSSIFGAGAIWITVQGLSDLATAFKSFGEMSWDEITNGMIAMGYALGEVAVITGALGALAGLPALLGGGAILLAVQGLGDLADAFKKFGEMSWDEIGRGLTAMGAALGEVALGSLLNILSGFGASAISEMAAPLGTLADSVKKWSGVTVPADLSTNLSSLATGVKAFTFGGLGAGALAEAAPAVGTMADSIKKWSGVTVPEDLGTSLSTLATGVKSFTFGGSGAGALTEAAPGVGAMADSVSKWAGVTVPENLGMNLQSLGTGVKAFTFGGLGASALAEAAPGVSAMADSVTKWSGVIVPENLGTNLQTLATGVKAFTFGGSGAGSLTEAAPGVGQMADSVMKWIGVTVPEGLVENLDAIATGVKKFTFGGSGAESIATCASALGTMADSVRKWTGLTVPEDLGTNLSTLATGVKSFTFGGSGAETLSVAATGLGAMADSVAKWSGVTIPEGLSTQLSGLATAVKSFVGIENISTTATDVSSLVTSLSNLAGIAYSTISGGISSLVTSITSLSASSSSIAGLGATLTNELTTPLKSAAEGMSSVGTDIANAISSGLQAGGNTLSTAATTLAGNAANAVKGKTGDFTSAGEGLASSLVTGMTNQEGSVSGAATSLASSANSAVRVWRDSFFSTGRYIAGGLINGIRSKIHDAYQAGFDLGLAGAQGAADGAGCASPSKLTIQTGKFVGEGLVVGMRKMSAAVHNSGASMAKDAISGISQSAARISDVINSDIGTQPTIRPVLDLSDIRAGAGSIGALIGAGGSIGVNANIGAVSSMMSARSQNGAEGEIVAAINKLRNKLDNVGNTTYTINGVTYDDGSNVSSAVQDLIRYARIERRV